MIPQTVLSLVAFLFLVAPGLVFELRRERRRPTWEETAFREASRIALASLLLSVGAVLVLVVVGRWIPTLLPDVRSWLRNSRNYLPDHFGVVSRFLLLELGVALLLAVLADLALGVRRRSTIRPLSAWYRVFRAELPHGGQPFVRVRVDDGTEYCGVLAAYSPDYALADRELVLASPLTLRRPDEPSPTPLADPPWKRVVIRGPAVQDLWVAYIPADQARRKGVFRVFDWFRDLMRSGTQTEYTNPLKAPTRRS